MHIHRRLHDVLTALLVSRNYRHRDPAGPVPQCHWSPVQSSISAESWRRYR